MSNKNQFKSTTIYGNMRNEDDTVNSVLADAYISRNLTVNGKINNIPSSTINYISNLTSDAQTQINSKSNISGNNTFTGVNTFGGLTINGLQSNSQGLLQLNDFNSLTSGFFTYIYNSSGINLMRSLGNLGTTTSHYFSTVNTAGVETYAMTLQNNAISLLKPTTITESLNVNNIVLNPAGSITYPSSIPSTTSSNAGLGITWNDPASGVGSGTGRTNFINYGQGGLGGFTFTNVNSTTSPLIIMTITPTSTNITGNTTIIGSLNVSNGLNFNSSIQNVSNKITNLNQLVFDNIIDTGDKIVLYNGGSNASSYTLGVNAGVLYYNSNGYHNFYSGGTTTTPIMSLGSTLTTFNTLTRISSILEVTGNTYLKLLQSVDVGGNPLYYAYNYMESGIYYFRSISSGAGAATIIQFNTVNASHVESTTMVLNNSSIQLYQPTTINGNLICPNGNGIYGNAFQAQSVTNAVTLATNLTSGSGLSIGSSSTPTNIYGSSTIVNGNLTITGSTNISSISGNLSITGDLNITGNLTQNNQHIGLQPILESTLSTVIQAGANTSGLSYTFVTSPYYSDSISVSCPIASTQSGTFSGSSIIITNTINSITCTVNKNSVGFANPIVMVNNVLPITKNTTVTGNQGAGGAYTYNFKQYFVNANITFQPLYENASATYTVTFTAVGVNNFEYNTTVRQIYSI